MSISRSKGKSPPRNSDPVLVWGAMLDDLANQAREWAARLATVCKTHQLKRGADPQSQEDLRTIARMKAEGATWKQIGDALDIEPETAKMRWRRARKAGFKL